MIDVQFYKKKICFSPFLTKKRQLYTQNIL